MGLNFWVSGARDREENRERGILSKDLNDDGDVGVKLEADDYFKLTEK